MKTIQNIRTGKTIRQRDVRAHLMTETGDWKYVPKSTLKQHATGEELKESGVIGRAGDAGMEFANPLKKKSNKMSKAMKRHSRRKK
tara:strand:- start:1106 stop:1363 length:258 start_codon:yes stop_codon:yes gene_type:complete